MQGNDYICRPDDFKMKKLKLIIPWLFFCLPMLAADEYEYGVEITTYPLFREAYTSVSLDEGRPIHAGSKTLELSFSLFTRSENVFGTIVRIITDGGANVDLMYTVGKGDVRNPMLVNGEYVTDIDVPVPEGRWVDVSMCLNPKTGDINVVFDGEKVSVRDAGTKGAKSFRISFGLCPFEGFALDDVASVNIKDVSISLSGRKIRDWDMGVHEGDICYDAIKHKPALCVNPRWILDRYITWNQVYTTAFSEEPHVAFDESGNVIMTTDGKSVRSYNLSSGKETDMKGIGGIFPSNAPNQLICLPGGRILSYNLDEKSYAFLEGAQWNGAVAAPSSDHDYWNNTSCWDEETNTLFCFGGYGHYRYRNELLIRHFSEEGMESWNLTIPEITPRYSPASCIVDSLIYIFGGRGNLSSRQELSPRYYYDLYSIDKKTYEVKCLWSREDPEGGHFVSGDNMIYDSEKDAFYIVGFSGNIFTLIKIDRENGDMERLSLPTVMAESAQYTYMNICRSGDRLYCVEVRSKADRSSVLNIYDMSYPPIPASVLEATTRGTPENVRPKGRGGLANYLLVLLVILLAAVIAVRKKSGKKSAEADLNDYEPTHYYDFSRSSVCFFGGFRVNDKDGNDITSQFTPTLKYLLVLLILYSAKHKDGILGSKLNGILWGYKSEDSANNNRNVYMSKLRQILEDVGDVKMINKNKFWKIQFGEDARCDYLEAVRLYGENSSEENVNRLLELLLRGVMLPNVELDWADKFKGDFSNATIDFLGRQFDRQDLPDNMLLQAADTVFQHDYLNEDALKAKCRILCKQGKVGLSKDFYDKFCSYYKKSIGEDYSLSFKDIIS